MNNKNILFVLTDQQRFDTIAALGNPIIKTPTLDKLVESGIAFTRAYTPSPVCVPARCALHAGKMPHVLNCVDNDDHMPYGHKSFQEILRENGYQTHGVGKMHYTFEKDGPKTMWGFESRDMSEEGGKEEDNDYITFLKENGYGYVKDVYGVRSEMYYVPQPSQLPAKLHNTTWVVDKSIEFLERRDTKRPFMLMSSFIKPHPPFEVPAPFNKMYRGPQMPLPHRPEEYNSLLSYWNKVQNRYKYRDQGIDDQLLRMIKSAYYGSISFVDYQLGRLIAYLEDNDLMKDTLIVFTSDHGELLGDYNSFGKRCFFDCASRVPLIVVDPARMDNGKRCDIPVNLTDILPTFLDYAKIKKDECYMGESLFFIADNKTNRDITFSQFQRKEFGTYMAATKKYKYIYSAPDQKEWLFDLKLDPYETKNVYFNIMYKDIGATIKKQLIEHFKKDKYFAPIESNQWKIYDKLYIEDDKDAGLLFQDSEGSIPHIENY